MDIQGKAAKAEKILLLATALFLCVLLALFFRDRAALAEAGVTVETAEEVPQADILPDLSPLDLNTATVEELATLPGIGEALARRIVDHRADNGPFESVEEIMEVSGIGEGKFAGLRDCVTVDGKETRDEDPGRR